MTRYVIASLAAICWMLPTSAIAAIDVSSASDSTGAVSGIQGRTLVTALQSEVELTAISRTVSSPSLIVAMPLADVFESPIEDPIAESQAIVAIEPSVASVAVPEPHSFLLWTLTIIAALCGSRAFARIRRR